MKKTRKLFVCAVCGFVFSSLYTFEQRDAMLDDDLCCDTQMQLQTDLSEINPEINVFSHVDHEHAQGVASQILKEAQSLFDSAHNLLDKLIYGAYEKDHLTFKDFVWGLKRISTSLECSIIGQLKTLQSDVSGDVALAKALKVVQAVAVELHGGMSKICRDLHPYERTKNAKDAYKVAKILQQNVESFITHARFNRLKSNLDEVISILSKKSGFNSISTELIHLQEALKEVGLNGSVKIDPAKVLSRIIKRIIRN